MKVTCFSDPDNARGYSQNVNNVHFGRDSENFVYIRISKMASYRGKEKTELAHKNRPAFTQLFRIYFFNGGNVFRTSLDIIQYVMLCLLKSARYPSQLQELLYRLSISH